MMFEKPPSLCDQLEQHMKCYLLLGANLGRCEEMFDKARKLLSEEVGEEVAVSSVHTSPAWGFESEDMFYNQALCLDTQHHPEEVLSRVLAIETRLGRTRTQKIGYESRSIDIDILFYENHIINLPHLQIPHKLVDVRLFALYPMQDIAPDLIHPISGLSVRQMITQIMNEA